MTILENSIATLRTVLFKPHGHGVPRIFSKRFVMDSRKDPQLGQAERKIRERRIPFYYLLCRPHTN
jgi:hypothetical protein